MIHTHTMTQLKTSQEPMKLLSTSNKLNVAAASLSHETVTTTIPVSTTSATVIPASSLNYVRIVPLFSTTLAAGQAIRVVGYTKSDVGNFFVPQQLFYGTVTAINASATAFSNASNNLYPALTITKQEGDAKVYNSSTTSRSAAGLIIDTLGCQFIEIEFVATAAGVANTSGICNAFYGVL